MRKMFDELSAQLPISKRIALTDLYNASSNFDRLQIIAYIQEYLGIKDIDVVSKLLKN